MAGAGASQRGAVNGTPFLSFFQCDCFENMATGTHNRVFWWQVLGPPRGVPLTAPLFSRFFSVIVLRIWQQVRILYEGNMSFGWLPFHASPLGWLIFIFEF